MAKRSRQRRTLGIRNTKSSDARPTSREVIAFIEKFLRIPDGPYAGQPLILAPWQKHEIQSSEHEVVQQRAKSRSGCADLRRRPQNDLMERRPAADHLD